MQKLRPYIMPGLVLFHLVLLCVMISTMTTLAISAPFVQHLPLLIAICTLASGFVLAAMRASLIRFSSRSFATSYCSRSFFAFKRTRPFMLSTAQLRL